MKNVILVRKALHDVAGRTIYMEGEVVGSPELSHGTPIETTTLDELAQEYGPPRILKMDIEGSEGRALRGASEALRRLELAELEVHDEGNYMIVKEALSSFDLRIYPAENFHAVFGNILRAPLYVLRLEAANRFATTRRVIRSLLHKSNESFPVLLFASRKT